MSILVSILILSPCQRPAALSLPPPILIVDDDEIVLLALNETLALEGFSVIQSKSSSEALQIVRDEPLSVIISDQIMPQMTGLEFLAEVKKIQPAASRILITGVLSLKTMVEAINQGEIYRFLTKPWIREELIATVHNAVNRYQLIEKTAELQTQTTALNEALHQVNQKLHNRLNQLSLSDSNSQLLINHIAEFGQHILSLYHPWLGEESKATTQLCERMIQTASFTPEEAIILLASARLHSIGLIKAPQDLFNKFRHDPDSLTAGERDLIHSHPQVAQELLNFIPQLTAVGQTIAAHRERWDGKGYPEGLRMESIPRLARILAVAVYYMERGKSGKDALPSIEAQSGKALDPEAVRLFIKATALSPLPQHVAEVLLSELAPGMVMARGIHSPEGLLLIPDGTVLNEKVLQKIYDHNRSDPILERLLVYASN